MKTNPILAIQLDRSSLKACFAGVCVYNGELVSGENAA
jgi:hypothetical protein